MRVLLASEWFPPEIGGVASHVKELALNLSLRGHEVAVLTKKVTGRVAVSYQLIELEPPEYLRSFRGLSGNGVLKRILERYRPDIVHAHHAFTPIPLLTLRAAFVNGYGTVLTNHSAYLYNYDYLLKALGYIVYPLRTVFWKTDRIIAVSRVAAKFIRTFAPQARITVIPNGVDTAKFSPRGSKKFREMIGGDFLILYVGRLVHRKGVHLLVDAMTYLKDEIPNAKLVIAGSGHLYSVLKEKIETNDLKDSVVLLGKVDERDLPDLYRSADIFVLPSLYGESFGIVVLEAMASGLPVIASPVGGVREVIKNCVNGILLKEKSPRSIALQVLKLYQNPRLRKSLALKARKTAVERYDWKIVAKKVEKVYEKILQERISYAITC